MLTTFIRNRILPYWRTVIIICTPLCLLPLPILSIGYSTEKAALCGYAVLIMAVYWMTESLPLPVTSLIPVVLFPLLGIMDTGAVCTAYMKESNMMFVGNIMLALAVEYCNLHKRIALSVLLRVGSSPMWLMFGFMITTAFLSIWISNTGTTALMVPIVEAVIQELYYKDKNIKPSASENSVLESESSNIISTAMITGSKQELVHDSSFSTAVNIITATTESPRPKVTEQEETRRKIRVGAMMSVSYAALIGGTGSLTGSATQLVFKGILQQLFGTSTGLNYATWMAFNIPGMVINLLLAWLWLQLLFIGFNKKASDDEKGEENRVKDVIRKKYRELGPMTFHEFAVLLLFILCVMMWFFRDPQFMPGWANYITAVRVEDSTVVVAIIILLFTIPAEPKFWFLRPNEETGREKPSKALMDWNFIQDNLPWGIVLLQGSGFALSDACRVSGLTEWLGGQLSGLQVLPPFVIMLTVCIMTAMLTEVASNNATANLLLPALAEMSIVIGVNPLYLMLPCTVTCSYAFMLPVATPPNAIVYSAAKMKPSDMIKSGFLMNIICVVVICIMTETLGVYMFNLYTLPSWVNRTTTIYPTAATSSSTWFNATKTDASFGR